MVAPPPLDRRPLRIGVVHLLPLPGSPRFAGSMKSVVARATGDAAAYQTAGFDGVIVENYGDAPFFKDNVPPETVAAMTLCAAAARDAAKGLACGVNVLRNDARSAVAVAAAADLDFVRVNVLAGAVATDQGLIEGKAADVLRDRARLCPGLRIFADVRVKHGRPLAERPIGDEALDLLERAGADAVIVTGARTGSPADPWDLEAVRAACPGAWILVGSGANAASVAGLLRIADGVIVGTAVKRGGKTEAAVDPRRARVFVRAARRR